MPEWRFPATRDSGFCMRLGLTIPSKITILLRPLVLVQLDVAICDFKLPSSSSDLSASHGFTFIDSICWPITRQLLLRSQIATANSISGVSSATLKSSNCSSVGYILLLLICYYSLFLSFNLQALPLLSLIFLSSWSLLGLFIPSALPEGFFRQAFCRFCVCYVSRHRCPRCPIA